MSLLIKCCLKSCLQNLPWPLFATCLRLPVAFATQTGAGTHRQKEGNYSSLLKGRLGGIFKVFHDN